MYTLPNYEINYDKYYIICIFNFSSNRADWDNPIKPLQDILQKKYKFNDCNITNALVLKNIVPKNKPSNKDLYNIKQSIRNNKLFKKFGVEKSIKGPIK